MTERDSNLGEYGTESIRLRGKKIENLPLGTGNQALSELQLAKETERLQAIADINAEYPSQRLDYLVSRINECEENKNRMKALRTDILTRQQEYRDLITKCDVRDRLLADLDHDGITLSNDEYKAKQKEILTTWGRWDADALREQIAQDDEAMERIEDVLRQEDDSIKEFSERVALVKERDKKLAAFGAKSEGS